MFSVNRPQNPIKKVRIGAIFRGTSKRWIHNLFKIQAGSGFQNLDNTSKKRYHKVTKFEEVNHLMEKKGTRIAYFVALAIVVIALVIAKVANDGSGFVATGWALFPPIVAIALALISKEVYSSLFLGCVVGALLLANFQPWQMVVNFIGAGEGVGMINAIDISILIFLVILGIMVDLMNKAGGSAAFGRWAKKAVKTRLRRTAGLTMLLGVPDLHRRLFQLPDRGRRDASRDGRATRSPVPSWPTSSMPPPLPFVCWLPCPLGPPPLHPTYPTASPAPESVCS